jgi:mannose/fructose/N-acetylgalactosamine-specific phosphotransferase system component IID
LIAAIAAAMAKSRQMVGDILWFFIIHASEKARIFIAE